MRVLVTTWGSRGDVEPLAGLAVAVRELGGEALVCAPPDEDFAVLLGRASGAVRPVGAFGGLRREAADGEGRVLARACAGRGAVRDAHLAGLPSQHFSPGARPGAPSPQEETDKRVLWEQDAQRVNGLYGEPLNSRRAAIGLPPVDNVRDYVFTDQPWLAADRRCVRRKA